MIQYTSKWTCGAETSCEQMWQLHSHHQKLMKAAEEDRILNNETVALLSKFTMFMIAHVITDQTFAFTSAFSIMTITPSYITLSVKQVLTKI
jgi:hypothetical protein